MTSSCPSIALTALSSDGFLARDHTIAGSVVVEGGPILTIAVVVPDERLSAFQLGDEYFGLVKGISSMTSLSVKKEHSEPVLLLGKS